MSLVIGPVHYWLYDKIRVVDDRLDFILDLVMDEWGEEAETIADEIFSRYGQPITDNPLDEVINSQEIHQWFERLIATVETREAAAVAELVGRFGQEAEEVLEDAYFEHGAGYGQLAREETDHDVDAQEIYKILNDYMLNGMPSNQSTVVRLKTQQEITWLNREVLQLPNWEKTGASPPLMDRLYRRWISGFVEGLNPDYVYHKDSSIIAGDAEDVNVIELARE